MVLFYVLLGGMAIGIFFGHKHDMRVCKENPAQCVEKPVQHQRIHHIPFPHQEPNNNIPPYED